MLRIKTFIPVANCFNSSSRRFISLSPIIFGKRFTPEQVLVLKSEFEKEKNPSELVKQKLANDFDRPVKSVSDWFLRERFKCSPEDKIGWVKQFTPGQKVILKSIFEKEKYPSTSTKQNLANDFNRTEESISTWFNHEREKHKKSGKESFDSKCMRFTEDQLVILKSVFEKEKYPSTNTKQKLSNEFDISKDSVSSWFHHERQKHKKAGGELQDSRKFTQETLEGLLASFEDDCYPEESTKKELAKKLKLEFKQVNKWFVNERSRLLKTSSQTKPGQRVFCSDDLEILETSFQRNHYPDTNTIEALAKSLEKEPDQVRDWFVRRREKHKKSTSKSFLL